MFNIGEYVVHGTDGVCQIIGIEEKSFFHNDIPQKYYVIRSVLKKDVIIYIPIKNCENVIRKVLTKEQIHDLILGMPKQERLAVENVREKNKEFKRKIASNNPKNIIAVIKTLYFEKMQKTCTGKNTHDSDIMLFAEKLLYDEFAFVLGIEQKEIVKYIDNCLQENYK